MALCAFAKSPEPAGFTSGTLENSDSHPLEALFNVISKFKAEITA
jgi:hypothetical protein